MDKERLKCGFEAISFDPEANLFGCEDCWDEHDCPMHKRRHKCDCGCICHEEGMDD